MLEQFKWLVSVSNSHVLLDFLVVAKMCSETQTKKRRFPAAPSACESAPSARPPGTARASPNRRTAPSWRRARRERQTAACAAASARAESKMGTRGVGVQIQMQMQNKRTENSDSKTCHSMRRIESMTSESSHRFGRKRATRNGREGAREHDFRAEMVDLRRKEIRSADNRQQHRAESPDASSLHRRVAFESNSIEFRQSNPRPSAATGEPPHPLALSASIFWCNEQVGLWRTRQYVQLSLSVQFYSRSGLLNPENSLVHLIYLLAHTFSLSLPLTLPQATSATAGGTRPSASR
jgi:hypothetical protein